MAIFRGTGGAGDSTTDATVTAVTTQAVIATTKASEAAASASESAGSASASATYAANAATSATSAGSSESESADSAAASANSAIAAANSATAAGTAKTNAETAETNAETAESNASTSATTATTKAAEAVTSASSASTSATTATTKAGESATSATSASTSATTATTKASEAVTSASSASTSAATATTKASEAETSATNAANSATAAATSAASIGTDPSFNSIAIAGEATMDGLTVGATAQNVGSAASPAVRFGDTDTGFYREGYNRVQISAGGKQVASFDSSGDVRFFEDTGTTTKLLWDASAESLGIGTSSPAYPLDVDGAIRSDYLYIKSPTSTAFEARSEDSYVTLSGQARNINYVGGRHHFLAADFSERMRIDSSGKVGIGASSPSAQLEILSDATPTLRLSSSNSGYYTDFINAVDTNNAFRIQHHGNDILHATSDGYAAITLGNSNSKLVLSTQNSNAYFNGKVGIGTASPNTPLNVVDNNSDNSLPTLGTASGVLNISNLANQYGLLGGVLQSSGDSWLQAQRTDGVATAYNILLNPVGGNVGIGTTSPSAALNIVRAGLTEQFRISNTESDATTKYGVIVGSHYTNAEEPIAGMLLTSSSSATGGSVSIGGGISAANAVNAVQFYTAANNTTTSGTERMRIDSAGKVGIGTSSPSRALHVNSASGIVGTIEGSTSTSFLSFNNSSLANDSTIKLGADGNNLTFYANSAERLRIDSTGAVLIGKTTTATSVAGIRLSNDGFTNITRNGAECVNFNRLTSDGVILDFRKDSTTVGSIGVNYGQLYIGTGDTGLNFDSTDETIVPHSTTTNAQRDAAVNLGRTNARFKDLYLSGGVYLGGTGAANKLEDYEEGTFNITVNGDATGVISAQTGNYVKIGKVVHIDCAFVVSTNFTSSSVGGLPFTPSIATSASSLRPLSIMVNNAQDVLARTGNGSTSISFHEVSNGTAHEPDTSSGSYRISGSYTTA